MGGKKGPHEALLREPQLLVCRTSLLFSAAYRTVGAAFSYVVHAAVTHWDRGMEEGEDENMD